MFYPMGQVDRCEANHRHFQDAFNPAGVALSWEVEFSTLPLRLPPLRVEESYTASSG